MTSIPTEYIKAKPEKILYYNDDIALGNHNENTLNITEENQKMPRVYFYDQSQLSNLNNTVYYDNGNTSNNNTEEYQNMQRVDFYDQRLPNLKKKGIDFCCGRQKLYCWGMKIYQKNNTEIKNTEDIGEIYKKNIVDNYEKMYVNARLGKFGLVHSGGGFLSEIYSAGVMSKLWQSDLMKHFTYQIGTSGGSWYMGLQNQCILRQESDEVNVNNLNAEIKRTLLEKLSFRKLVTVVRSFFCSCDIKQSFYELISGQLDQDFSFEAQEKAFRRKQNPISYIRCCINEDKPFLS